MVKFWFLYFGFDEMIQMALGNIWRDTILLDRFFGAHVQKIQLANQVEFFFFQIQ